LSWGELAQTLDWDVAWMPNADRYLYQYATLCFTIGRFQVGSKRNHAVFGRVNPWDALDEVHVDFENART
jgi:hypothetical protein